MANVFSTNSLLLTKQEVRASGQRLYVSGVEVTAALSGNLIQSGVALGASIALTGQQAWLAANNNGLNLSGSLNSLSGFTVGASGALQTQITALPSSTTVAQTGSNLYVLVTGLSGATNTLVIASGASEIAHANGVGTNLSGSLTQTGVTLIARDLVISGTLATGIATSGQAAWVSANGAANSLSGQLTTTGQMLYQMLTGTSGQAVIDYATKLQLTQSGVNLGAKIDVLSGFSTGMSGALQTQIAGFVTASTLAQTGSNLYITITGMSGQAVFDYTSKTSLTTSGQTLYVLTTGLSGSVNTLVVATGASAVTHSNGIGTNLSGALTQTGVALGAKIDVLSGFLTGVSGALSVINIASGASEIAHTNGMGTILSGNMTATGSTLYVLATGLSGATNALVIATGASVVSHANGGDTNLSGNMTLTGIALIARNTLSSGWLQTGINSLSGFTTGMSGALQALIVGGGVTLSQLNSLSGYAESTFVHRTGDELVTGVKSFVNDLYITGRFAQGIASVISGLYSAAQGSGTFASGDFSHSEGVGSSGLGTGSHAEGNRTRAHGAYSHAEGIASIASGSASHVEGQATQAVGDYAHAEGLGTRAFNQGTHAEGNFTNAYAIFSHSEGNNTKASGAYSHAMGGFTITDTQYQLAAGRYNRIGVGALFQIGRGDDDGSRTDAIYVPSDALMTGLLGGNWQADVGFRVGSSFALTGATADAWVLGAGATVGQLNSLSGFTTGMSGALQALIAGGGTQVKVSGSSTLVTANLTGIGSTTVSFVSGYVVISSTGGGAGGGDVTTAQLVAASGALLAPSQTNLNGGTGLLINTIYYDNLFGTRRFAFSGTPADSNYISIYATVTGDAFVQFPASYRLGQIGTTTGLMFTSGNHELLWSYSNGKWWLADTSFPSGLKDDTIAVSADGVLSGDVRFKYDSVNNSLNIGVATTLSDNPLAIAGSGAYLQANIQNRSTAADASSDWIATSDIGSDESGYIDVGINGSRYLQTGYSIVASGDGYLYVNGGNLAIGTQTSGRSIKFHTAGTTTGQLRVTIDDSGVLLPLTGMIRIGADNVTGGSKLDATSLRIGVTTISGNGMAGKPGLSISSTGWGNNYFQPAFYDNRAKFFSPNAAATQSLWGDSAANVGTLAATTTEVLGDFTQITPAAGLSAGSSMTTATFYRGSVLGVNGFFFSSKFVLNQAWASGNSLGVYGAPSGCRVFVGMTDQAVATQVGLNEPAGSMVGLNYLWASGGAVGTGQYMQNWAIRTRNNVATTTGDIGMVFQTGFYRFSMYCPPFPNNTQINWELKDLIRGSGVAGVVTATLPVNSTAMRPMVALGFVSGIKTIGMSTLYAEKQGSLID